MHHTHLDGSAALSYIINHVFQVEDDNSLELALESKGCKDIYDLISMTDIDIDSLTYTIDKNTIVKLQACLRNKIKLLQQYITYRYCSNEPIGNDWKSITEEKFDNYRTSTYFVEPHVQLNTEMKATLLLALIAYDSSKDCKTKVKQNDVINYDTLSNVASIGNEIVASEDNHPPFDSTNLNFIQYCDIDTLVLDSSCLEMGSCKIKSVSKHDSKGSSKQQKYVYPDVNAIDDGSISDVSIVPENASDFFQRSWDYDFDDTIDRYIFPSTVDSMEEIIFYPIAAETEQLCQLENYYLKEMIDVCANKTNVVLGIVNNVLSNMNRKWNVLKVAHEDGMTGGNKLLTDMVVFEPMSDPICDLQLVIDRGRVNSMQADGE